MPGVSLDMLCSFGGRSFNWGQVLIFYSTAVLAAPPGRTREPVDLVVLDDPHACERSARHGEHRGGDRFRRHRPPARERPGHRPREEARGDDRRPLGGPALRPLPEEERRPEEGEPVEADGLHRLLGLPLDPVVEDPRPRVGPEGAHEEEARRARPAERAARTRRRRRGRRRGTRPPSPPSRSSSRARRTPSRSRDVASRAFRSRPRPPSAGVRSPRDAGRRPRSRAPLVREHPPDESPPHEPARPRDEEWGQVLIFHYRGSPAARGRPRSRAR